MNVVVARIERSEIREGLAIRHHRPPDFATLNPGYGAAKQKRRPELGGVWIRSAEVVE
jgi:orotidine-5'-phosphate decarboxylase